MHTGIADILGTCLLYTSQHAVGFAAAQHQNAVTQLQQNVQVLANINHGNAFFFLLIQQVVNGVDVYKRQGYR